MKTIFWNVDTQYDFMRSDETFRGTLAIPGAREIEGNLEKLTNLAKEKKITVVNTADWHTEESREISKNPDYRETFPTHCIQWTKGAEYVPATGLMKEDVFYVEHDIKYWHGYFADLAEELSELEEFDVVIYKDHFDVFQGNPYTNDILKALEPEAAVVYGVATNVCVNYAVLGLLERGIKVYVPTDAIKELPGLPLEEVLSKWKEKGARLIKTEDVKNYL